MLALPSSFERSAPPHPSVSNSVSLIRSFVSSGSPSSCAISSPTDDFPLAGGPVTTKRIGRLRTRGGA